MKSAQFFYLIFALVLTLGPNRINAADDESSAKWYDHYKIRGYFQLRYNRLLESNQFLTCDQCDKSIGGGNTFFIRRARLIFNSDAHSRVYVYIQPDLASSTGGNLQFLQIRDAYADLHLDSKREFRLRIGQSKVPFGWETLQSSSVRLPLDRTDAINSAAPNERDVGVFFYWAPAEIRERFKTISENQMKGSGDYGVFGLGTYVGQSMNRPELNNQLHQVARVTYPFELSGGQIIEAGIQAYSGLFTIAGEEYADQRIAASLIVYPQPLGLQAEWNIGRGPEFDSDTRKITVQGLNGGYALVSYFFELGTHRLMPFFRSQYYDGGKKQETDARSYRVFEQEVGMEWQPWTAFRLTTTYAYGNRKFRDAANLGGNSQSGGFLRLQAQVNY